MGDSAGSAVTHSDLLSKLGMIAEPGKMKAIFSESYGPPERLKIRDIPRPTIGDHDVLVRVRATALNVGDCFAVRGSPRVMRLMCGLVKPDYGVPGVDLSGQVEAVGNQVTKLRPGDEVFGACKGACAEFVSTNENQLSRKPGNLSFEQAAALPTAGLAALKGLLEVGQLKAGQKVLINGASGGIGTLAVQIAKAWDAEVTAVCSTGNVLMLRTLGADYVIDYTRWDFTRQGKRYDLILDNIENHSLAECRRALTDRGTLVLNSGTGARGVAMLVRLLKPLVMAPFLRQNLRRFVVAPNSENLDILKNLVESRTLKPVIDRIYALSNVPEALSYIEGGHARGKVIVSL